MPNGQIKAGLSELLHPLHDLIEAEQEAFIHADDGRKRAGYFCSYTPPEVLNAAGIRHARLFKAGSPEVLAQGDRYTQSVFCDFSKSCLGAFDKDNGDPLYLAVDRLYNFHTCASMKRVTEVLADQFVPTVMLNLPRLHTEPSSRDFYRRELSHYAGDVGELAGRAVTPEALAGQIRLTNRLRRTMRKLSELRKRKRPPLSGRDYLELVRGYYYVPPERLADLYEDIYRRFAALPERGPRRVRLMLAGSKMADGERQVLDLLEDEIGAQVVIEDSCTGLRPFHHPLPETGDPFRDLAEGYLDQPPCARMKPIEGPLDASVCLAEEYGVDGVVYVYLKFCSCYGVQRLAFIDAFQKRGIPLLELSRDYSANDHGQMKTRVEAFIEVLADHLADPPPAAAIAARPVSAGATV